MVTQTLLALVVVAVTLPYALAYGSGVTCANITDNTCRTGSCKGGGISGGWQIPYFSIIEGCSSGGYGTCLSTITSGAYHVTVVADSTSAPGAEACCAQCKLLPGCKYWQYRTLKGTSKYNTGCLNSNTCTHTDGGYCYQYLNAAPPTCYSSGVVQTTSVGAVCSGGNNDPHFVGAQGARFDFNGLPGKTFCLVTDANLHINMKMTGYLDSRTEGAVKLTADGKAVRTWIKELAFMWTVGPVEAHSLHLVARGGAETARGEGFLKAAVADGVALPRMQVGEVLVLKGGLTLTMVGIETSGPYEMDFYNVKIDNVLDMDIRLRVAHKLLRKVDDAEVHINFGVNSLKTSAAVHGVLGQTYRLERAERNVEFAALLSEVSNLAAESETGKGFLDGVPENYVSSEIMATDCAYTTYEGHTLVASAE